MTRAEIVAVFEGIADIMQIKGDDPRRYQMYRKIARILDTLQEDIHVLYEENKLIEIPGIGSSTMEKVGELIDTGQCEYYEELKASIPAGVLELTSIAGVGPATAGRLYQELGIDSLESLQQALDAQKLRGLKGMGSKTEEKISEGLEARLRYRQYELMGDVLPLVWNVTGELLALEDIGEISLAGDLRRKTETVTDAQIVAACDGDDCAAKVQNALAEMEWIEAVDDNWTDSGGSARLTGGLELQVELTGSEDFGSKLIYSTGSAMHIIGLGLWTQQRNLMPLGTEKSADWTAGKSEEEIYSVLGLPCIAPELRESGDEIEVALRGKLPRLVEASDIRGDLHVHSTWSDGVNTIEAMAEAAREMGYEYIAMCDHSISSKVANGLSVERLLNKLVAAREIQVPGLKILMGSEVDILKDGSLDYPDEILEKLDVVIASVHSGFGMDEATMTKRLISAVENRFVHIIGHPTGRLLSRRDPYQVNMEALIDAAVENNTALELNAYPDRLDLKDIHARMAKEQGAKLAINTDAHGIADLRLIIYGIYTARRGWLEKKDVLNTLPLDELIGLIAK